MPGIEDFLDRYIPGSGDVALDVGANRGYWSRFLADRFATVYAIEPHPALQDALRSLAPNVRLIAAGAWDKAERRTFTQFAHDANTSAADNWEGIMAGPPVGSFEAECLPLDEMPIEGVVDFIKVDAEAAEVEVVRGAEQIIQSDRPHMIIEVHTAQNGAAVQQLLGGWGYRLTMVRHPYYDEANRWWNEHYWLVCNPEMR